MTVERTITGELRSVLPDGRSTEPAGRLHRPRARVVDARRDRPPAGERAAPSVEARLRHVLENVRDSVEDWPKMRAHALTIASELKAATPPGTDPRQAREASRFLEWLAHNNFTFLGYREYALRHEDGHDVSRAGGRHRPRVCCATTGRTPARASCSSPAASRAARDSTILIITKANSRATVHRDVYLDYISVKRFNARRRVRRRAALPRALRLGRLQRHHPRHPAARRAGRGGAAPHRPERRQPLGQGHPPDPRDLPARRALPDQPAAARRHRDERPAPAGAPQDQALHPSRRVRPLRLLPRLPPARPLQHDGAAAHRVDPARGLRR